jgi:hypothetical protein
MAARPARTDGNILQEAGGALGPEDPHDAPFQAEAVEGTILVFLDDSVTRYCWSSSVALP